MVNIPANFSKKNIVNACLCVQPEEHIYECNIINSGEQPEFKYEQIFKGDISEQIKVFRKFERNFERCKTLKENMKHNILPCDPFVIRCAQPSLVMD